jgi:hypothetical protein
MLPLLLLSRSAQLNCTMNEKSDDKPTLSSKVALVDLAGSERQTDTGATGDTLKQVRVCFFDTLSCAVCKSFRV